MLKRYHKERKAAFYVGPANDTVMPNNDSITESLKKKASKYALATLTGQKPAKCPGVVGGNNSLHINDIKHLWLIGKYPH